MLVCIDLSADSQSGKDPGGLVYQRSPEVPLIPHAKVARVLRQFIEHLSPGSQGQESSEDKDSLFPLGRFPKSANILLYEVGGNINAGLLDLPCANPHSEWVIKQSPT
ncbi:hypothetical protein MC885_018689 [Smutsia gigantea]|nr:hypothetical protein MC885_018689 [Smutsia gigantea]